jgi:hypothetical protein
VIRQIDDTNPAFGWKGTWTTPSHQFFFRKTAHSADASNRRVPSFSGTGIALLTRRP